MKKTAVLIVLCLIFGAVNAYAAVYTFSPYENTLGNLAHDYYYTWGVKWDLPAGEQIESATLTFKNIWDWKVERDQLYTHLLDSVTARSGWRTVGNYQTITITGLDFGAFGDAFAGQGLFLGVWDDPVGGRARNFDLVYEIPDSHLSWLADGNFGFGIDPDCHYYNSGIELKIVTSKPSQVIPEPFTVVLASLGFGALGGLRRFAKK